MAKRGKVPLARKPRDRSRDDNSLLLRSAESLGRVIATLQRQLDDATKHLSGEGNVKSRRAKATGATKTRTAKNNAGHTSRKRTRNTHRTARR